jgi:hypothetical protein
MTMLLLLPAPGIVCERILIKVHQRRYALPLRLCLFQHLFPLRLCLPYGIASDGKYIAYAKHYRPSPFIEETQGTSPQRLHLHGVKLPVLYASADIVCRAWSRLWLVEANEVL